MLQHGQPHSLDLPTLEDVRILFQHWRQTRQKAKEPIPDYLWDQVLRLTQCYSNLEIQRHLGINAKRLSSKTCSVISQQSLMTNDFIQVSLPENSQVPEPSCSPTVPEVPSPAPKSAQNQGQIELIHPNGMVLRIAVIADHQLTNLVSAFMKVA